MRQNKEYLKEWHLWFALFPVYTKAHERLWLTYVERKGEFCPGYLDGWNFEYRSIGANGWEKRAPSLEKQLRKEDKLAEHTPGPWYFSYDDAEYFIYAGEKGNTVPIAQTYGNPNKANARLMAAAPKMAAAIQNLLTTPDDETRQAARNVIAQAQGE